MSSPRTAATFVSPIVEARRWVAGRTFSDDLPLINVSQAAPVEAPPKPLREFMAQTVLNDSASHIYGAVLGLPELRAEIASQWSRDYGGAIDAAQVAITAGCNQAFCAVMSSLCGEGDEVILPTPWYFNHKMWLDLSGIQSVPLQTSGDMIPDPIQAAQLITDKTRAIVLVTPNNPSGVHYPATVLSAFYDLCRARQITLIVDETYRDFDSRDGAAHDLFCDTDWPETLVHLYSFSKTYRLTGHRVGAVIAAQDRLFEIEKFLDTVSICAPQLGQRAALWGLQNLHDWKLEQRDEILRRLNAISQNMPRLKGWKLLGLGAYFAYVEHPFAMSADDLAQTLVKDAAILALPGTMFAPPNDPSAQRQLRIAFANLDVAGIEQMFKRLENLTYPLAHR